MNKLFLFHFSYAEAHKVQISAQQLEVEDQEKWEGEREQRIAAQQALLMKKQGTELKAMQKRIQTNIDTKKKQKALELER